MPYYEHNTPFVGGSDTSHGAAASIDDSVSALRAKVFEMIDAGDQWGATCDEVEVWLDMKHQTASARIRDLVLAGVVRDSGNRRRTRSGRWAVVWVRI